MTRALILAIAAATALSAPTTASAQGVFLAPPADIVGQRQALSGRDLQLHNDLRRYGFGGVDVTQLSNRQRVIITQFVQSGRSEGDIRGLIRTQLRRR